MTSFFINTAKVSSKSRRRQGKCVVKSEMCRTRSLESESVKSKRHTQCSVQTPFPHVTPRLSDSLYSPALPRFHPPPTSVIIYLLHSYLHNFSSHSITVTKAFHISPSYPSFSLLLPFPNSPVPLTYSPTCHVQHNGL
jgi:hypothetical protein